MDSSAPSLRRELDRLRLGKLLIAQTNNKVYLSSQINLGGGLTQGLMDKSEATDRHIERIPLHGRKHLVLVES